MPIPVRDPADPRLADYVGLTDTVRRTRLEPAYGLFIAEGELVVRRAADAGLRMRSLLLLDRYADALAPVAGDAPVYVGDAALLEAVTGFDVHRGVLAAVERPPPRSVAGLLAAARRLVVVEDVSNPTNVGAVFRCAAALGLDGVLLSPRCADPLYRRAVRVSMGAVLAVSHARVTPWPAGLGELSAAGFRLLALTPDPAAAPLESVAPGPDERVALLLGAEGPGLTVAARAAADLAVRIPMAHGVDSLNIAAAAAIACYVVGHRDGAPAVTR